MDKTVTLADAPYRPIKHMQPVVDITRRDTGEIILDCPTPLGPYPNNLMTHLRNAAHRAPDRDWLCERDNGGDWIRMTYADGLAKVNALSQALLDLGLTHDRPVMILSGNSIAHGLLSSAAIQVGIPAAPISVAYCTLSENFAKLKHCFGIIRPGLIFAEDGATFEKALQALDLTDEIVVSGKNPPTGLPVAVKSFDDLMNVQATDAVQAAFDAVTPDTHAKYLFTSGSTGMPKAVVNKHRMLCANQVAMGLAMQPDVPPVYLDWLPWNHTYGGNSNFNGILREAGTLYIDGGRAVPGAFDETIRNLREVAPTSYRSVAAAYAMLIPVLEDDDALCRHFFSRLEGLAYGGASLPEELWRRIEVLAVKYTGHKLMMTTGWGSTETGPTCASLYWPYDGTGNIGLPLPGTSVKMVPNGSKMELRVKGEYVFEEYWRDPKKTAEAFDDEGYYKIGDAGKLIDPNDPVAGMRFDGRVVEDFKLLSGTFVSVGTLRTAINSACDVIQDCVIAGHDRDYVAVLAWPNEAVCRKLAGASNTTAIAEVTSHPAVIANVQQKLAAYNKANPGGSTRVQRVILMAEPPSSDGGEITDKGYVNQRATLENRDALVQQLYQDPAADGTICVA